MDFEFSPQQERWLSIGGGVYLIVIALLMRMRNDEIIDKRYMNPERIGVALLGVAMILFGVFRNHFRG